MPLSALNHLSQADVVANPTQRQLAGLRRRADEVLSGQPDEVRDRVRELVGGVFFGMLIKQMRKTVPASTYFHGGRGEQVFMGQFDQEVARRMSETLPPSFIDPMVEQTKRRLQSE